MKKGNLSLLLLAALFFLCVIASQAGAQPFVLTKVADTNTPIPSGSGKFAGFSDPVINDGKVAFGAAGTGQQGIYWRPPKPTSLTSTGMVRVISRFGDLGMEFGI